jgi:DNA polymerase I
MTEPFIARSIRVISWGTPKISTELSTERLAEFLAELKQMLSVPVRGSLLAVVMVPTGLAVASHQQSWTISCPDPAAVVQAIERHVKPRWLWWSASTAAGADSPMNIVPMNIDVAMCWDLCAVHRLLFAGWKTDPARVWARLQGLSAESIPSMGQLDLLGDRSDEGDDTDFPVRPDGHLRPEWISGHWRSTPNLMAVWAQVSLRAYDLQVELLGGLPNETAALTTARSESLAELLCTELEREGLPLDIARVETILESSVGARPRSETDIATNRERRDKAVLVHLRPGVSADLRNPAQVRAMLRTVGVDVPDTRAGRLEPYRSVHPLVDALLVWRKAERLSTTYGYNWLDQHVDSDSRLRGSWSGSDGAAGRMTAQAGLHNLPAELREAVAAEPGYVFVHADLGQIEPRVLAAVSGDAALASAAQEDDMYAPVAKRLSVDRATAKLAVLGAMYGATSGVAGEALRGLERAYPTAMAFLDAANKSGLYGIDIRTHGGRLVRMKPQRAASEDANERSAAAAQGRYARNALIQGAAAELFKAWAVTVRGRVAPFGAHIVMCLHDELLIHTPVAHGEEVCRIVERSLPDAANRWMPNSPVRYVVVASTISRWSDAK